MKRTKTNPFMYILPTWERKNSRLLACPLFSRGRMEQVGFKLRFKMAWRWIKSILIIEIDLHLNLQDMCIKVNSLLPAAKHVGQFLLPQHYRAQSSVPPERAQGKLSYWRGTLQMSRAPVGSPSPSAGWTCWSSVRNEALGFLLPRRTCTGSQCLSVLRFWDANVQQRALWHCKGSPTHILQCTQKGWSNRGHIIRVESHTSTAHFFGKHTGLFQLGNKLADRVLHNQTLAVRC